MPKYAKFMKDLFTNKTKLEDTSRITLNERCSTTLLNRIPLKERDPGSSTIPCIIGGLTIEKALTDLGEIDFVILDMKEDSKVPIILGRPFLANAHAMIVVFNKKISLEVGNETITFDIEKSMKYVASTDDTCHYFDRDEEKDLESEEENKDIKEQKYLRRNKVKPFTPYVESDKEDWEIFSNKKPNPLRHARKVVRCMIAIFQDMCKDFMEVFMDDLSVFGHKISSSEIEVDKAEVDVVAKLPYLTNVKVVRSL
ncbi:hypothetical protein Tco_0312312 [Tanacetum coccineum]